jgi:hypothetical protein
MPANGASALKWSGQHPHAGTDTDEIEKGQLLRRCRYLDWDAGLFSSPHRVLCIAELGEEPRMQLERGRWGLLRETNKTKEV